MRTRAATITGSAHAGSRLVASASWRPAPASTTYRWLRDGKPIAKATGRSYRLRAADIGHRVAVQVRAVRSDALAAISTSPAKRVAR
jgi:hypothetical protein